MGGRTKKLKRQSGGSPEQPPDPFVLFLDETSHNCKPIHASLESLQVTYIRHGSKFPSGADDEVWLPVVGEERWAILTCDKRIRYNQLERDKIMQYGIREFVFTSGNLSGTMMGEILDKAVMQMEKLCAKHPGPFIATISQSGKVAVRWDKGGSVHAQTKKGQEADEDSA
jgi:PIN like domain